MKTLTFSALALASALTQAADTRAWYSGPPDHIAKIGQFSYEIRVNRAVTPPQATAQLTAQDREVAQNLPPQTEEGVLLRQRELLEQYISSITGVPAKPHKQVTRAAPPGPVQVQAVRDHSAYRAAARNCPPEEAASAAGR